MVILLSSCVQSSPSPTTEFYFDTFDELDTFLRNVSILDQELTEVEIKSRYPDYNEDNGKILPFYRQYVYVDLISAHEKIVDANYKMIIYEDNIHVNEIAGAQTLQFIYKVEDDYLKAIVLTIEPVSENRMDYSSYVFSETDSSLRTIVNRNSAVKGYEQKDFVENLGVDSYIENGKIIRPTYEIRYAINETNVLTQNLKISFFYSIDYERVSNNLNFEGQIISYISENMNIYYLGHSN